MKIKDGFILRKIADTYMVIAVGDAAKDFGGMISLNETGAFLWEKLEGGCDNEKTLVKALTDEYDVDEVTALRDVKAFMKKMSDAGFAE